jgi:hypothetical protein
MGAEKMTALHTESQRANMLAFIAGQPLPLDVECKRWRKSRSNEQNALLWKLYEPIADAMGFDREDLHEWFCGKMWGWKDVKVPRTPRNPEGYVSVPYRTTTRNEDGKRSVIDKETFSRFVDLVERTAAQAGVYVQREAA